MVSTWVQYKEFHIPEFVHNQNMNKRKNVFTQMHIWIHIKHDIRGWKKGFNRLSDLKIQHRVFVEALSPIINITKKSNSQEQGMCSQMKIKLKFLNGYIWRHDIINPKSKRGFNKLSKVKFQNSIENFGGN